MQFYPHRTVEEQAERLPEQLREAYKNSQIDRITIFDGTEELEITGYAEYSYLEEKSYKTQPVRTQDGAIQDIEEYSTFFTPRLIIKYNMMNIDDYRALMKMLKRRNGFIIKCYDVVEDAIARNQMYVATPSMPIIYQQFLIALGVQEYNIELIGTNVPINPTSRNNGTPLIEYFVSRSGESDSYSYVANLGQTWRDRDKRDTNVHIVGNSVLFYMDTSFHILVNAEDGKKVMPDDYVFSKRYEVLM